LLTSTVPGSGSIWNRPPWWQSLGLDLHRVPAPAALKDQALGVDLERQARQRLAVLRDLAGEDRRAAGEGTLIVRFCVPLNVWPSRRP
jgi:hypothetical protein